MSKPKLPFDIRRVTDEGVTRSVASKGCIVCNNVLKLPLPRKLPSDVILKKMEKKGWRKVNRRGDMTCPNCQEIQHRLHEKQKEGNTMAQPAIRSLPAITTNEPKWVDKFETKLVLKQGTLGFAIDAAVWPFLRYHPSKTAYFATGTRHFRYARGKDQGGSKMGAASNKILAYVGKIPGVTFRRTFGGIENNETVLFEWCPIDKVYKSMKELPSYIFQPNSYFIKETGRPNPSVIKGKDQFTIQDGKDLRVMLNEWLRWAREQGHDPRFHRNDDGYLYLSITTKTVTEL